MMKKLRLSMDELRVETFQTMTAAWPEAGTVRARQGEAGAWFAGTGEPSNCDTCETCKGPNCCGCADSTAV
jgi:hypothetical protein